MAPLPQYIPLPFLDHAYTTAAATNTNATFDSPDWEWGRDEDILAGAYVPYICEAILVILIFVLCILDHRLSKPLHKDPKPDQSALYATASEREFADWRREWEPKFPDLFIGHAICTICLDTIGDRELIRGLPCLHVFHRDCMDAWFEALHVTCPLCKQNILMLPTPCYRPGAEEEV